MQWFLPRLAGLSSYPLLSARRVPHWWALQGAGPAPGLVLWWLLVLFLRRPQVPARELELKLEQELKLELELKLKPEMELKLELELCVNLELYLKLEVCLKLAPHLLRRAE